MALARGRGVGRSGAPELVSVVGEPHPAIHFLPAPSFQAVGLGAGAGQDGGRWGLSNMVEHSSASSHSTDSPTHPMSHGGSLSGGNLTPDHEGSDEEFQVVPDEEGAVRSALMASLLYPDLVALQHLMTSQTGPQLELQRQTLNRDAVARSNGLDSSLSAFQQAVCAAPAGFEVPALPAGIEPPPVSVEDELFVDLFLDSVAGSTKDPVADHLQIGGVAGQMASADLSAGIPLQSPAAILHGVCFMEAAPIAGGDETASALDPVSERRKTQDCLLAKQLVASSPSDLLLRISCMSALTTSSLRIHASMCPALQLEELRQQLQKTLWYECPIPSLVCTFESILKIVEMNKEFESWSGYGRDELSIEPLPLQSVVQNENATAICKECCPYKKRTAKLNFRTRYRGLLPTLCRHQVIRDELDVPVYIMMCIMPF